MSDRTTTPRPSRTKFVGAWAKVSENLYVHDSGAQIERRGYPEPHGWYLVLEDSDEEPLRFEPTPQGCDDAFLVFTARRISRRAGHPPVA